MRQQTSAVGSRTKLAEQAKGRGGRGKRNEKTQEVEEKRKSEATADRIIEKSDVDHMVARASLGIKAVDGREPNAKAMEEFVREHWKALQHKMDLSRPLVAEKTETAAASRRGGLRNDAEKNYHR